MSWEPRYAERQAMRREEDEERRLKTLLSRGQTVQLRQDVGIIIPSISTPCCKFVFKAGTKVVVEKDDGTLTRQWDKDKNDFTEQPSPDRVLNVTAEIGPMEVVLTLQRRSVYPEDDLPETSK